MAVSNADKKAARETTLQLLIDAIGGLGSSDNTDVVDALTSILGELQGTLSVGGSVELGSSTVSGLQTAFTNSLATSNTDLQTIAGSLSDIHAQLINQFESGDLVGMSQGTLDGIGAAVAALFHYPTDYPDAAALVKLTALVTALAALTDGTQKTKINDGTNTANVVSVASGWNAQAVIPAVLKTSYSAIVADPSTVDALGYSAVVIAATANSGTWSLQGSNDNVTFFTIPIGTPNTTGPTVVSTGNSINSTGLYQAYTCGYRYIRLHRASGTLTADMTLYIQRPFEIGYSQSNGVLTASQSGAWAVTAYASTTATTSINAATSATTGSTFSPTGGVGSSSLQVIVGGTGSWSALTVVLEGSLDGVNWWTLATYTGTASGGVSAANQPALRLRARTTTATAASGVPTVTAIVIGTV